MECLWCLVLVSAVLSRTESYPRWSLILLGRCFPYSDCRWHAACVSITRGVYGLHVSWCLNWTYFLNTPTDSLVGDGILLDCAVFVVFMNRAVIKMSVDTHSEPTLWSSRNRTQLCDNRLILEIRSPLDEVHLKSAVLLVIRPTRYLTSLSSSGLR
jgi:hypothetical protein